MAVSATTARETTIVRPRQAPSVAAVWLLFAAVFVAVQFASLFSPPLLDDADAAHAETAQRMLATGNWITPKIDGIRYLEKPPLPDWFAAVDYYIFGENVFSAHLPNALSMLGLMWLAWMWSRRAWGDRAGLYAGLFVVTAIGPFLFTRFMIPEAMLSFFLLFALYCFITGLESNRPVLFYGMWASLALATLAKGLMAPIFLIAAAAPFLLLTGQWRRWRDLKPFSGLLLYLAIAAPWHILCGLANPDQGHPVGNHPTIGNVHGFWYFYFINEQVDRFFGTRYPVDYNKLPGPLYWLLHFVWLYPWSLFLPVLFVAAWKTRHGWMQHLRRDAGQTVDFYLDNAAREDVATYVQRLKFRVRSTWLLGLFAAFILVFFSISTNQEYYTFEAWTPILMLTAGMVAGVEEENSARGAGGRQCLVSDKWLLGAQAVFAVIGIFAASALGWGLWFSRNVRHPGKIGDLLAHRDVAGYTLSMSHIFDLTGQSFAALRLPSALAAVALLAGAVAGWVMRRKGRHLGATLSVVLSMAVFLVAAHIAFAEFAPMLTSKPMAETIIAKGTPNDTFIIYDDQSDASSVLFYTRRFFHESPALIVMPRCGQDSQGSTLLWGSCYPDAPDIFLSDAQLAKIWGTGNRKWLFAQGRYRTRVEHLLAGRLYPVQTLYDKTLWTDRPLQ
ncbi:MAG TPA: glycosyltransferase family 39 protein [Terracidiphilus sp.]|nr:glycosyltransferase family 39 protein [Terracidiphilus sp.]